MRRPLLLLLSASALAALAVGATAGSPQAAPAFREYESPVATGHVGLPTTGLPHTKNYSQDGVADVCGEPSLGIDAKTGAVLYQCVLQTLRVTGFDRKGAGSSTWTDVTGDAEGYQTSDPILYTDPTTNRTWVNQLELQGCSLQAFTDDDGKSWTPSLLGCGPGIAFDHQTLVAGPPSEGSALTPVGYPNLLYYCTNDVAATDCAVSIDGGETFLPARPVDTQATCTALTGHVKTAVDGSVYLMPGACGSKAGIYVSRDNTMSWTLHLLPGSTNGNGGDPSLGVAHDGTLYAAYASADNQDAKVDAGGQRSGRVHVQVSTDHGTSWKHDVALGADLGVVSARFPEAVAGDGKRAAIAYLGTTTSGDTNSPSFTGVWRLYVSMTYDGGRTWHTYDATPKSPVQVGEICTMGTTGCLDATTQTSPDRNLLDFMDMVVDKHGYVAIAVPDGCTKTTGCTRKDRKSKGLLVRQVAGKGLYARYDG